MPILESGTDRSVIRRILRTIAKALFHRGGNSGEPFHSRVKRAGSRGCARTEPRGTKAVRQRMAEEVARLERLDAERERRGDSRFGMTTEDRIIWRELIDLELQEIDDRVRGMGGAAGGSEGGTHERDDT